MQYIDIDKSNIPYKFDMSINSKTYTFFINYSAEYDYFTVDLYRNDTLIVAGEKIVYGRALFLSCQHLDVPKAPILPYDISGREAKVTWDNFNETVFLWLVSEDG